MIKILFCTRNIQEKKLIIIENYKLKKLYIKNIDNRKKTNIYLGVISYEEPSLGAVFIDYGEKKKGFLPYKEIIEEYLLDKKNKLKIGNKIIIQILKEKKGNKGTTLTTFITLTGSFIILLPNTSNSGGISRKIVGEERKRLKFLFTILNIPKGMSIILRTTSKKCLIENIKKDYNNLLLLWQHIKHLPQKKIKIPLLLYTEDNINIRIVMENIKNNIKNIIVDNSSVYRDLKKQINSLPLDLSKNLILYKKKIALMDLFGINLQIRKSLDREITLKSGGTIIFELTEALTTIDINSMNHTKETNIESTALITNLEALKEIVTQIYLRDSSGLIIIDAIDMFSSINQKYLENKLLELFYKDKAKIQITKTSNLGLIEISRQRTYSTYNEHFLHRCLNCQGYGLTKSILFVSLSIIRNLKIELNLKKLTIIKIFLKVNYAIFLLNKNKNEIYEIEKLYKVKIILIPSMFISSFYILGKKI